MTATTPEKVRNIAKHLKSVDDPTLKMYIDDAKLEVGSYKIKKDYEERLQRYLAAHLASLDVRRKSSQSIEGLSVSYEAGGSGGGLNATTYGQEYLRLLKKAHGIRLTVI